MTTSLAAAPVNVAVAAARIVKLKLSSFLLVEHGYDPCSFLSVSLCLCGYGFVEINNHRGTETRRLDENNSI